MNSVFYVIGSGPAGVSCAHALVSKGFDVIMLDAGNTLESNRQKTLHSFKSSPNLDRDKFREFRKLESQLEKKVPRKLSYGSDYPYRDSSTHLKLSYTNALCTASFAKGGFTTVWGASILPYSKEDTTEWPFEPNTLTPYYKKVLGFVPIASNSKYPSPHFSGISTNMQEFNLSAQATAMLFDLKKKEQDLNAAGVYASSSSLAVDFSPMGKKGCVYCGMCMYGCPYGLIYSSATTVDSLMGKKNFKYRNGIVVEKIEETSYGIKIDAYEIKTRERRTFKGKKAFLGAGTYPSTRIMLNSLEAYNQEISIKDSQYFLFHLLRYERIQNVSEEKLHALNQIFIEIFDSLISKKSIHLQMYTYNEMFEDALKGMLGGAYPLLRGSIGSLVERMMVGQGYLHSDSSSKMKATLEGPEGDFVIAGEKNPLAEKAVHNVMKKLFALRQSMKAIPLSPLVTVGEPGSGNHTGSSFPMVKNPKRFQSDIFGCPKGFNNLHIVDSSIFPSIPAQTMVLPIMANAYRIGDSCKVN